MYEDLQAHSITIKVTPDEIGAIDFRNTSSSHRKIRAAHHVEYPITEECDKFFAVLNTAQNKPAILKVIPEYADQFIPNCSKKVLLPPLTQLYWSEYLQLDYLSLLNDCEEVTRNMKAIKWAVTDGSSVMPHYAWLGNTRGCCTARESNKWSSQ